MTSKHFKFLNVAAVRRTDQRGYLDVIYEQGNLVLKRSFSKQGVFRGMHWQRPPNEQTKLVRVMSGRILDFILDPTEDNPKVYHRELTSADGWIQIDSNYAHGFYAIEDTEFEYLCHGAYNEVSEVSYSIVGFLQAELNLINLILSAKDMQAKPIEVINGNKFSD